MSNVLPLATCNSFNSAPFSGKAEDSGRTTLDQLVSSMNSLGTGADVAFVVYAMQIQKMNQSISDELKNIQYTSRMRDAMSKDLEKLRQLKTLVEQNRKGDTEDRANMKHIIDAHGRNMGIKGYNKAKESFYKTFPMRESIYSLDKSGKVVTQNQTTSGRLDKDCGVGNGWGIYTKDIDARIDNISDKLKKLDSNREVKMIMLNQMLNKKGNAVSQLTNMIKQAHNTEQSIINNLK